MANHSDLEILDLDDLLSESDSEEETTSTPAKSASGKEKPEKAAPSASKKEADNKKKAEVSLKKAAPQEEPVPEESASDESADSLEIDFIDFAPTKKPHREQPAASEQAETSAEAPSSSKPSARPRSDRPARTNSKQPVQQRPAGHRRPAPNRQNQASHEDEKQPFPLHLALLAAIVVLAVVAVVRFLIWNKGSELKVRIGENKDKYIIEVNDNMVYLSDSKLEGHEDDGVTTVLCLGNEPFSQDTSESGLAGQIASLGGCNVINAAFPGSQVTCENAKYSTDSLDSMDDIFNLFYVSYAISIGDFSSLETVASAHTEDSAYQQSVEALKNTDFSKVDIIAIMYDGTDYINGMAMQNPDVPDELTTYVGSLTNSFKLIQDKYPYIRIVFMSPYYAEYDGVSSRTTDLGNGTIVNYFQWAYDTCGSSSVSFLDNYYGSVNENNYKEYLSDDVHLNAAGCTKVADHFVYKVIQDNYAEYNVSSMAVANNS